ncbi:hypothetical protein JCM30237_13550 [Halolamina litorea]|uniref:Pentapeptide repeat-containing protein n=1 Tax=Halolamina litorea TaxID=1515593 RepID=A0ABD6BNE6_9EURY|nr:pentapeptide repeat-containing protein [Halolamina litorea]
MTKRRREGERDDVPARPTTEQVDTEILRLSPDQRRARGVTDDAVRAAFYAAVIDGDREQKDLSGATLPGLSLSYAVVGGDDNHPIDLRGATITGHLDVDHADVQVPLLLDDAEVTGVRFDETKFDRLSGADLTVIGDASMPETRFREDVDLTNADFGGGVDLDGATFDDQLTADNATFSGELSARGAEFHGSSNRLEDNTSFAGARFASGADFTQAGFGFVRFADASFEGEATFHEAGFEGDAGFRRVWFARGATFDEARFGGDAVFDDGVVEGAALFRGAVFSGGTRIIKDDASFDRVTFGDRAAFDHASFRYASFTEADFKGLAEFEHVRFDDDADFPGATFVGEATFDEARFVADSDFSETAFRSPVAFRGAEFLGDANHYRDSATFVDAVFVDDADFGDATFTSGDFEGTRFGAVADFGDVTVRERLDVAAVTHRGGVTDSDRGSVIDMSGISFPEGRIVQPAEGWVRYDLTKASLGEVELTCASAGDERELLDYFRFCDTEFTEFDGKNFDFGAHLSYLERNNWVLHTFAGETAPDVELTMTADVIERTYLKAKNCASLTGDTTAAGEFRVKRQQFSRRKNLDVAGDPEAAPTARVRNLVRAGENAFLEVTCGHGMRLLRIVAIFLLLPLFPALLFAFGGPAFATTAGQIGSLSALFTAEGQHTLYQAVRFSYVTYTTIAYGQINPIGGLAVAVATIEAYLSAVFAALVVYALVERSEV